MVSPPSNRMILCCNLRLCHEKTRPMSASAAHCVFPPGGAGTETNNQYIALRKRDSQTDLLRLPRQNTQPFRLRQRPLSLRQRFCGPFAPDLLMAAAPLSFNCSIRFGGILALLSGSVKYQKAKKAENPAVFRIFRSSFHSFSAAGAGTANRTAPGRTLTVRRLSLRISPSRDTANPGPASISTCRALR